MTRESTILYPSPGRCIYCGNDQVELFDEHIVPFALDGHYVIDDASCADCAKFTCRAETRCLNVWMKAARTRLKISSRRKPPTELPLNIRSGDRSERKEMVPIDEHHGSLFIVAPPPPIMLAHLFPPHLREVSKLWLHGDGDKLDKAMRAVAPAREMVEIGGFDELAYARMIAKIAHSLGVVQLGLDNFIPLLTSLILEKTDDFRLYVGGDHTQNLKPAVKHQIQLNRPMLRDKQFAVVAIQLFAKLGAPVFQVVVGQIKSPP